MFSRAMFERPAPPAPTVPLHRAAYDGDVAQVSARLAAGANVSERDESERTALHWAARQGHKEVARALLKWGADVDAPGPRDATALVESVREGHASVIRLLLSRGAQTEVYQTPEPTSPPPPPEEVAKRKRMIALFQEGEEQDTPPASAEEEAESRALLEGIQQDLLKPSRFRLVTLAVKSGQPEALRALLEAGLDPNERFPRYGRGTMQDTDNDTGYGPVKMCITLDAPEMLRLLIAFGGDVNGKGINRPLCSAVMSRKLPLAQMLLEAGADPNQGYGGMPPLAFAIHNRRIDMVELLVKHGASTMGDGGTLAEIMSVRDEEMRAALNQGRGAEWHPLVKAGDVDAVRSALDAGKDINARGDVENTALMIAAQQGNSAMVHLLLERGADPLLLNRHQFSAMHYAAMGKTDDTASIVRALVARNVPVDVPNAFGQLPLSVAALRQTPGVSEALRDAGAMPGIVEAALLGEAEMVKSFVDAGVPVDARNGDGMMALMGAAAQGNAALCQWLIARGANVNGREKDDGDTALHWAARRGHTGVVQALLDAGAEINASAKEDTPLLDAAQSGQVDVVRLLLTRGASVAEPETKPTSPVSGLVHALLWNEVDFHKRAEPLVLPLLLDAGADPNARNGDAQTPLAVIWENDFPEAFAQLFLAHGADVDFTIRGKSWLLRAVEADDASLARRLLDAGADVNRGNRWFNPLDVALARGNEEIAALLRERGGVLSERPQEAGVTDEERAELLKMFVPSESVFGQLLRQASGQTS